MTSYSERQNINGSLLNLPSLLVRRPALPRKLAGGKETAGPSTARFAQDDNQRGDRFPELALNFVAGKGTAGPFGFAQGRLIGSLRSLKMTVPEEWCS